MADSDNGAARVRAGRGGERDKALSAAVAQIEKDFGKGSIMRLGDEEASSQRVEVTPFGIPSLDRALGAGGLPNGRVVEIFGPEASGKTSMALQAAAASQRRGGVVAFIDAEHALDPVYAAAIGVNIDELYFSQPSNGEEALEIADTIGRSSAWDLIVVDSVAALVPRAEIEGQMGDAHVGLQARLMSQALRKLQGSLNRSNTTVVFINQLREQIGVTFGSPYTTPGGKALKYYSSVRMDVKRIGPVKQGPRGKEETIGNRTQVKIAKNKVAAPMKTCELDLLYGEGISVEGDIIDLGLEEGLINRSGAYFSLAYAVGGYPAGEQIGQGREKARARLKEEEPLREALLAALVDGEVDAVAEAPSETEDLSESGGTEGDSAEATPADTATVTEIHSEPENPAAEEEEPY